MSVLTIGWTSQILLAVILLLAIRGRFLNKYWVFYAFVAGLFLIGLVRYYFLALDQHPQYYFAYWYTQFIIVSGSYGVLWQIYDLTLRPFQGAARIARALVGSAFAAVWVHFVVSSVAGRAGDLTENPLLFERNVQVIQVVLLSILIALIWYYGIPLGKNLFGMLVGHGLFTASRLVVIVFQSVLGTPFYAWRYYAEPLSFLATIVVWLIAFRSYCPAPIPAVEIELERDYQFLARRTSEAISRTRGYLTRGLLP